MDSVGGRGKNRGWTAKSRAGGGRLGLLESMELINVFRGRGKLGQKRILVFIILKQFQSIDIGYLSEKRGRVIG